MPQIFEVPTLAIAEHLLRHADRLTTNTVLRNPKTGEEVEASGNLAYAVETVLEAKTNGEEIDGHIAYWFEEVNSNVEMELKALGLWKEDRDGQTIWHYDRTYRDQILELTDRVMRSYDNDLRDGEVDAWQEFDLGGDDDVDYNGGYIESVVDLLEEYITNKDLEPIAAPLAPLTLQSAINRTGAIFNDDGPHSIWPEDQREIFRLISIALTGAPKQALEHIQRLSPDSIEQLRKTDQRLLNFFDALRRGDEIR